MKKIIENIFYIFIFLLPFQTRKILYQGTLNNGAWEYGTFSIYATEILLWCILVLYCIYSIKNYKRETIRFAPSIKFFIFISILLYLFINILSITWAENQIIAFHSVFRLVEAIALAFFIINFSFSFKIFSWSFALSGATQSIFALMQFFSQSVFASKWLGMAAQSASSILGESVIETHAGRFLRAYGTLPHPNILGGFLALSALFSLYLFLHSHKRSHNILSLGIFILNILGVVLTFSRSASIALVFGLVLYFASTFLEGKKLNKVSYAALLYVISVVIFSMIYQEIASSRANNTNRLEKKSIAARQELFEESVQLISQRPLTGVGAGNFTYTVFAKIHPEKKYWEYQPVHSIYLLIASETGIFSLIIFLALLSAVIARIWFEKNFFALSLICMPLIIGFFDHYFFTLYFGIILFWIIFGANLRRKED